MSALTKVLVILTTVVTIVLVTLVVTFVAKQDNLRDQLTNVRTELQAAQAAARLTSEDITRLQQQQASTIEGLEQQTRMLNNQIVELNTDKARLQADLVAARSDKVKDQATIDRLTATNRQNSELLTSTTEKFEAAQETSQRQQSQLASLENRINELDSEVLAYQDESRFLREQLTFLRDQYDELEQKWNRVPMAVRQQLELTADVETVVRDVDVVVHGRVTRVVQAEGDINVEINVGTRDQVQRQMEFRIHRGGQYLATMRVETVDVDAASGRVDLDTLRGEVQAGDMVITGMR